ncbi:uncharacterized protein LOC126378330 [Pectinophora gossypiella]|uniref:uncharacterized protein LOC126378330 n=1 Tax=Pectinophora gossypiella TaxID=13191 RepID=UPI00214F1E83|nr:uncharacterized protein LOC126378330 [Pectinophora gossypiella]
MADLKELIAQRGRIKARITLFERFLKPILNTKLNKVQFYELTLRFNKIKDILDDFDKIQSQIESLDSNEDIQLIERQEIENRFYSLIAQSQDLLQTFESSSKSNNTSQTNSHGNTVKLPPLKIPSFNGDPNKWLEFRDMYLSLIHNNDTIDDISKFHYLKSYLEGSAKAVINSVCISSSNYNIAWSLLCDRYDNKRLLINEHIKCLFSIQPLSKESDKGLRDLIDAISKNLSALASLGEPTTQWDTLIIYMASSKLDPVTSRSWEEFRGTLKQPDLANFFDFLRQRATVLETMQASKIVKSENRQTFVKPKSFIASSPPELTSFSSKCLACNKEHKLYECNQFKSLPVDERIKKVFQWRLCSNCLRSGHRSYQCNLGGCRICKGKHNTVLHKSFVHHAQKQTPNKQGSENNGASLVGTNTHLTPTSNNQSSSSSSASSPAATPSTSAANPSCVISMSAVSSNQALLSTALVKVTNNDETYTLRALLDSGSQSSFITDAAMAKIGMTKVKSNIQSISGLSNAVVNINEHCNIVVQSSYSSFKAPVKCFVLPIITDRLPHAEIHVHDLNIPSDIQLADPKFYQPSDIDLLLGADIFWDVLGSARIKLGKNKPILQETLLGWIVAGSMAGKHCDTPQPQRTLFSKDIHQQLSKFWELEEVPKDNIPSFYDHPCEKIFNETTYRDDDGRFCVQIPLHESPDVLGESYHIAEKRLFQMEKKMSKNLNLRVEYNKFLREYESLGHMTEVAAPSRGCFLPHHAVTRESSETTKLRVVFDASAETTTGTSFNDIQHVGPVVQDDLFSILLRFRQHRYVVSADVEKMYRQVLVHPEQRPLQMILWRASEHLPIKIFQLNTVTYGTASAPFLSTRCLLQLAKECPDDKISELIRSDFYVDDFLSGCDSEKELMHNINKVTEILHSACFPLRKFRTNAPCNFINNQSSFIPKDLDLSSQSSALGLKWDPVADVFIFPTNVECPSVATKRTILSNSAKLFDPLGLLSPCTIIPKIILQNLWLEKHDWDDEIPSNIEKMWLNFVSGLNDLSSLQVPRWVLSADPSSIELHAFSDASQNAYAACVYLRSVNDTGKVVTNLLCAKTKVSPVKPQTIPRLELCGALLAARLSAKVLKALRLNIDKKFYWCDSSVVLGWLSSQARDLKTFVSNRVAEIQELTSSSDWRHIPGIHNPADLASRGLDPKLIHEAHLWWHGPTFLSKDMSEWPQQELVLPSELPEIKTYTKGPILKTNLKTKTCTNTKKQSTTKTLTTTTLTTSMKNRYPSSLVRFERYSKLTTLQRSLAYVLRFTSKLRGTNINTGHLSTEELQESLNYLIKQHQIECFSTEINLLSNNKCLPSKSRLLSLRPFLDEHGILRVGGRIQQASENYEKKHPILLESKHHFTNLLFAHEHKRLLHCGPQLLLTNLRQTYWPIAGRRLARSTVNSCRLCTIIKAKNVNPIMGNLPGCRVTPNLPFSVSGVDFAGPFPIRDRRGRGCKIIKSYLCLFVCFSTRALHLEIASDLSTEVFLLCLKRFISRRGKPTEIHCDNGRNFVGANNDLKQFLESCNESISSFGADEGIKFKFSPAYSPHFGGLWEAGVKSAKYHLTRIIGNNHLTYEELSTLFVQVEAILNSRPLTPLSSDPTDLYPLTPGHFLIGRPLTSLPSPALLDVNPNRLNCYQRIEQMKNHFWNRWRHEFLCELQHRAKWRINKGELLPGDMVILKEANLPPLKWKMGRIHQLYPGKDGIARVVDVMTSKGIVRRPVVNLCPLPVTADGEACPRATTVVERGEDVGAQ